MNAGYLSKANAQFSISPIADTTKAEVRDTLHGLHPGVSMTPEEAADEMADRPGAGAYRTSRVAFEEIFKVVPKARAMACDGVSYEELSAIYWCGSLFRETLFSLVCKFNAGEIHPKVADLMGDLYLVGIEKRDDRNQVCGTRPIGIPAAIRRLSGRVAMHDLKEGMGEFFTKTEVPEDIRRAAGLEPGRKCKRPMQLGVGTPGGAEIIIAMLRLHLERWADHSIIRR